jgi:hypothetical protein
MYYDESSDDNEKEVYNGDTYLVNVTSLQQPIKSRKSMTQNVNQRRNFLELKKIGYKYKGHSNNRKNTSNRTINNIKANESEIE